MGEFMDLLDEKVELFRLAKRCRELKQRMELDHRCVVEAATAWYNEHPLGEAALRSDVKRYLWMKERYRNAVREKEKYEQERQNRSNDRRNTSRVRGTSARAAYLCEPRPRAGSATTAETDD